MCPIGSCSDLRDTELAHARCVARLVSAAEAPLCCSEARLLSQGATVTRLQTRNLLAGSKVDVGAVRFLGRLYDGLIVPASLEPQLADIASAAGVPVVCE
jgi:hypothetical protein